MTEIDTNVMQEVASEKKTYTLSDDFVVNFVFNSLSFEGYVVPLEEVKEIIEKGNGSDDKKVLHIQNYKNGLLYVVKLLNDGEEFGENRLKDLHEIIMNGIIPTSGLYRNVDISIKGSNHTPPSYVKVYDRMKKYFDVMNTEPENIFEQIAFSHLQLMKIHPFLDGNGRCARIVLNYFLMKNGYSPVIIPLDRKDEYFNSLEKFKVDKDITVFMNFLKSL